MGDGKNGIHTVRLSEIRIPEHFWKTRPKREKMERKMAYYLQHGRFESDIIVDANGWLVDGFTTYLLAGVLGYGTVPAGNGSLPRSHVAVVHRLCGLVRRRYALPHYLTHTVVAGRDVVVSENGRRHRGRVVEVLSEEDPPVQGAVLGLAGAAGLEPLHWMSEGE